MSTIFWTEDFFKEAEEMLNQDPETARALTGIETSILLRCDGRSDAFLVQVASGRVSAKRAATEDSHEFTLSATYEEWVKVARGEEKVQREIVRGRVRFAGSWPKMLLYINKVVRLESEMLKKVGQLSVQY